MNDETNIIVDTKWNLGNFTVELKTLVNEAISGRLACLGLRFLGQRVSAVDKILGGFEKKGDKDVRKAGWKRTDAPFSPDLASKLAKAFEELELPGDDAGNEAVKLGMKATFTEYVPTAGAPKFVEEKALCVRHESKGDLEEWLKTKVGYAGETHGADGEYDPAMLAAVKAYKIEQLRDI